MDEYRDYKDSSYNFYLSDDPQCLNLVKKILPYLKMIVLLCLCGFQSKICGFFSKKKNIQNINKSLKCHGDG